MWHEAHFCVTITGAKTYTIQRMQDADGDRIWAVDSSYPTQIVTLSPAVSIGGAAVNKSIEFNQRGLPHSTITGEIPAVVYVPLTLTGGSTKPIEVWPSGQVLES
jgi:hypothetical protein